MQYFNAIVKYSVNSADPDETAHDEPSHLNLHWQPSSCFIMLRIQCLYAIIRSMQGKQCRPIHLNPHNQPSSYFVVLKLALTPWNTILPCNGPLCKQCRPVLSHLIWNHTVSYLLVSWQSILQWLHETQSFHVIVKGSVNSVDHLKQLMMSHLIWSTLPANETILPWNSQ